MYIMQILVCNASAHLQLSTYIYIYIYIHIHNLFENLGNMCISCLQDLGSICEYICVKILEAYVIDLGSVCKYICFQDLGNVCI